jgi:hypothetical protein
MKLLSLLLILLKRSHLLQFIVTDNDTRANAVSPSRFTRKLGHSAGATERRDSLCVTKKINTIGTSPLRLNLKLMKFCDSLDSAAGRGLGTQPLIASGVS